MKIQKSLISLNDQQINNVMDLYSSGNINLAIKEIQVLNEDYPNVPLLYNLLGKRPL